MAFKMKNSPAKLMWPWNKKARRRRQEKRRFKEFEDKTTVIDGKTYLKSDIRKSKADAAAANRAKLESMSDAELEAMRNK